MMRIFFTILFIVSMFAFNVNAQTEIAQTAFERGVTNARAGEFENALNDFQKALEKQRISNKNSAAFLAKINYNIGVCLYRLNRSTDAV
ncbi:MAG: tetratricopeptide repeat protein, partial [Acidobacteriota bacterium]